MKKLILLLLGLTLSLTSCDTNDDDEQPQPLTLQEQVIGNWLSVKMEVYDLDQGNFIEEIIYDEDNWITFIFKEDGIAYRLNDEDNGNFYGFTYILEEGNLIFQFENNDILGTVEYIKGNNDVDDQIILTLMGQGLQILTMNRIPESWYDGYDYP